MTVPEKVKKSEISRKAMALYRLPDKSEIVLMSGEITLINFEDDIPMNANGFIMAPFDNHQPSLWLKAESVSTYNTGNLPVDLKVRLPDFQAGDEDNSFASEETYKEQVKAITMKLRSGVAGKVVLTRQKSVHPDQEISPMKLFQSLCALYAHAFVYMVYVPGEAVWTGATPETLMRFHDCKLSTMALAGTRPSGINDSWGEKEKEEHEFVSRHIYEKLISAGCSTIVKSGTYQINAGQAAHLRTDFEAECDSDMVPGIVRSLHPTPAVCGWPSEKAIEIIRATENFNRSYYTGFLGPVSPAKTDLFVNLRCMQLFPKKAILYVGGGLTASSDPAREWEETELKSTTMLAAIEKMRNLAD